MSGTGKDTQIVWVKPGKINYEIIVRKGATREFREGKMGMDRALVAEEVFTNAKTGDRAAEGTMLAELGVKTKRDALELILRTGHCELTTAERAQMVKERRQEAIGYIIMNYTDLAGHPVPETRIENALALVKGLRIDPEIPGAEQAPEIVSLISRNLPLKQSSLEGTVTVPYDWMGQADPLIRAMTTVVRTHENDTNVQYDVKLPPGKYDELLSALGKATKGYFSVDFGLGGTSSSATAESDTGTKGKAAGKGGKRGRSGKGRN